MGMPKNGGFTNTTGGNELHTLTDNFPKLTETFPLTKDGLFGERRDKNHARPRHVKGDDPHKTAQEFFDLATEGAESIEPLYNGRGWTAVMKDGTRITFRPHSSSDASPAIDITESKSPRVKNQKIHFIPKGDS